MKPFMGRLAVGGARPGPAVVGSSLTLRQQRFSLLFGLGMTKSNLPPADGSIIGVPRPVRRKGKRLGGLPLQTFAQVRSSRLDLAGLSGRTHLRPLAGVRLEKVVPFDGRLHLRFLRRRSNNSIRSTGRANQRLPRLPSGNQSGQIYSYDNKLAIVLIIILTVFKRFHLYQHTLQFLLRCWH